LPNCSVKAVLLNRFNVDFSLTAERFQVYKPW
jgi:hypothetical protein